MSRVFAKAFYNSKAWQSCRDAYASSVNHTCARCGEPGVIVHHKVRLTKENINDPTVTLNWQLLELVCVKCHNKVYNEGSTAEGLRFDAGGDLVPTPGGVEKK